MRVKMCIKPNSVKLLLNLCFILTILGCGDSKYQFGSTQDSEKKSDLESQDLKSAEQVPETDWGDEVLEGYSPNKEIVL